MESKIELILEGKKKQVEISIEEISELLKELEQSRKLKTSIKFPIVPYLE